MKKDPIATAHAAGVTTAIIYIVCRVAIALFPDLAMTIAQSWFHGLEISKVSGWSLSLGSFILGLVTISAGAWLVGYAFAVLYNYFLKNK